MAGSVNKVTLVGNLGKDPEVRNAQNGSKIVTFSLATSESWTDKQSGERRENTEWHRVVIFNERIADVAERYLAKGRKVYVEGTLKTRKWTDQSGQEKYSTEIVIDRFKGELTLLDSGNRDGDEGSSRTQRSTSSARPAPGGAASTGWEPSGADLDDDIPF